MLDLNADIIDIRDIIERFEELETIYADCPDDLAGDDAEEFTLLQTILDDLKGDGGDEQWRGDWYPVTLIRDSYYTEYAEELVKDCYNLPSDIPAFIEIEIDWVKTGENMLVDYSETEIDGTTYYYR